MPTLRTLMFLAASYGWVVAQPAPGFRIAGHVVHHADNRPAKRVRVSIAAAEHVNRQVSCISGDNGEFSFTGLPPGKYMLQVTDHGWTQSFHQFDDFSTAITVGPDLDSEHVIFPLDSPARITGTVLDEEGDPVAGAAVLLFTRSIVRGLVQTQLGGQANTGTDGDFHFTRLTPGTYYIAATGRPWYAQNMEAQIVSPTQGVPVDQGIPHVERRSELDVAYPLVYHDGELKLEEGGSVEIHLTMRAVPALHIAVEGFQKQEGQQLNLQVFQIGPGGNLIGAGMGGESGINGIAPGNYVVSASLQRENQSSMLGSQTVTLTDDSTIHLGDAVPTSAKGKVTLDGDVPPSMAILLVSLSNGSQSSGSVTPEGTFEVSDIQPGRYFVMLVNNSGLYIDSVKEKGGGFKNGELTVAKGAELYLTITAAKGLTKVNGKVVKGTRPIAGAMVLLVPQDPGHGNFIPRDQSDSDGTFTLNWAPPGRYTLLAVDNGRGLAYADPAAIAPYLEGGQVVDLPLAKDTAVHVEVQSRK